MKKNNTYTTDGKVVTLGTEKDVNAKLAEIIGTKFTKYGNCGIRQIKWKLLLIFPYFFI